MITLDAVSKTYRTRQGGRRVVLNRVSAEFPGGCNIGVLGANGAGKSTLIRLLAGSEMPDQGRIRRDGRVSFPLGYGGTFHGALSGRENIAFIARVYGADLRRTIDDVADFSELGGYFRYYGANPYGFCRPVRGNTRTVLSVSRLWANSSYCRARSRIRRLMSATVSVSARARYLRACSR